MSQRFEMLGSRKTAADDETRLVSGEIRHEFKSRPGFIESRTLGKLMLGPQHGADPAQDGGGRYGR